MVGANIEVDEVEEIGHESEAERLPHSGQVPELSIRSAPLRVLMAAGGTGGHIFPALAVAGELVAHAEPSEREEVRSSILFLGTARGLESRLIPAAGFELRTVAAAGLKGIGGWKRLANLSVLPRSAFAAAQVLKSFRPDVVVGVGGYLAGPILLEAAMINIPTLLIEPNAVPGLTNRILAPVVRGAAVGFDEAASFYGTKARVTGNAVREAFFGLSPKPHLAPYTVLVVGGSQGSKAINECAVRSFAILTKSNWPINVVHQTGEKDYNGVREMYREQGLNAEVCDFIEDMPKAFARADLLISRAGATAVGELAAAGKAAVLIPFPGATDQHQLANARVLERAGAACVLEQRALTPERLAAKIGELFSDPARIARIEQGARRLARPDAARRIADWILELGMRK